MTNDSGTSRTKNNGLECLVMLARFHAISADPDQLMHQFSPAGKALGEAELVLAARALGLKARIVHTQMERLARTPLPALGFAGDGRHFVIGRADDNRVLIHNPQEDQPQILSSAEFRCRWNGRMMLLASRASIAGEFARFDFSWFIPAVIKYRKLLLEVLGVSLVVQLFALITPLFFQIVMDKVLVHSSFSTLNVIALGLLAVAVFDTVLNGLRNYVFSHTTNRIDVELSARLFRHLLALPLSYFTHRRVGDSVARVRELENIRTFLTGQAMTSVLDLAFIVVFLAVMFFYSGWLTLLVILSLPLHAFISMTITPVLRARLDRKFAAGADNQSFLVESVTGVETIKAMAVEPQFTQRWEQQIAAYVAASFRVLTLATLGQQGIQLINKLLTVGILWFGAHMVIDGTLTVGQLIAFNMLAGHVTAPIVRLAQLWQELQQVGISMQRLGDILITRTEMPQSRQALPAIQGRVSFEDVAFRYRPDSADVIKNLTLNITPGEVIGIVGRSGSGKSTLTKLLQRLYLPSAGQIRIDGIDLALADPIWLRRQVGVVLQENLLFNRSIRDNIALTTPGLPLEDVIHAARLAGAHDFICALPEGYDTMVGEHGCGLSGGQRQRIAIARALVMNPRILIFDEATSALDYESERVIQNNMQGICQGRTVLIIAHRLSAVRQSTRIIAMDEGRIVESGHHDELISRPDGYYARLIELQKA